MGGALGALFAFIFTDGRARFYLHEQPLRVFQNSFFHFLLVSEVKMAPAKGPSVLHTFVSHYVSQHVMVMMMVHFHPAIDVVMHAFVHHRSLLGHSGCRNRDCGQRRQYVENLLH
jgi:hypothetical protein